MSAITRKQLPAQDKLLVRLENLCEGYGLSLEELKALLLRLKEPLKLELVDIEGSLYLSPLQLALIDSLKERLRGKNDLEEFLHSLEHGAFIYRCTACGELFLTGSLLLGDQLQHACNPLKLKLRTIRSDALSIEDMKKLSGRYQLLASGPLNDLLPWLQSLKIHLDDSLRGI